MSSLSMQIRPQASDDSQATRHAISRAAVAGAVAGNALEFYDFVIYAFFAVYIGKSFFPRISRVSAAQPSSREV